MQGPEALVEENLHVAVVAPFLDILSPCFDAVGPRVGRIRPYLSTYLKAAESSHHQDSWHGAEAVLQHIGPLEEAMWMPSERS